MKQPSTIKARDMIEQRDKVEYFEYEVKKYIFHFFTKLISFFVFFKVTTI